MSARRPAETGKKLLAWIVAEEVGYHSYPVLY
jgi:hypothetical protein